MNKVSAFGTRGYLHPVAIRVSSELANEAQRNKVSLTLGETHSQSTHVTRWYTGGVCLDCHQGGRLRHN